MKPKQTDLELIFELARAFRNILDQMNIEGHLQKLYGFTTFPKDACDSTCRFLGKYLFVNGIQNIEMIFGNHPHLVDQNEFPVAHVWLMSNKILIDITADQFHDEIQIPVIVSKRSRWHSKFLITRKVTLDSMYFQRLAEYPSEAQRQILSRLNIASSD